MKHLLFWLLAAWMVASTARAQSLTADWAVPCATDGQPYSLAADSQGNIYVAGTFSGTITLGSTTLTATQPAPGYTIAQDVFLAKLDAQGHYLWALQFGDGQRSSAYVGAADKFGNVYVAGSFTSYSLNLGTGGPILYNSSNDSEGFVAQFSGQTGQCQWARRFGGTGADYAGLPVVNAAGEVFLTGTTGGGAADLGSYTLPAAPAYGSRDFLAKLSPSGSWLWAQQFGTNSQGNISINPPVPDGLGNLYLTGTFTSPSLTLGPAILNTGPYTSNTGNDLFVAKLTESGTVRWARQANPGGRHTLGGGRAVYDGLGHLYLAGSFDSQAMSLGNLTLTNAGPLVPPPAGPAPPSPNTTRYFLDGFVARYDTAGTWQWAVRRGSYNSNDYNYLPTLDGTGRLLVLYAEESVSSSQLTLLNHITGAWQTAWPLPAHAYLSSGQLEHTYVYGGFIGTTLNLGGQTVPGAGSSRSTGYVARLGTLPLAAQPAAASSPGLHAWPSPGPGTGVWVQGVPAGKLVEVFDMLGRRVGAGLMPASGPLRLGWPGAGLAAGVYVLRSGAQSGRWVVEN